MRRDRVGTWRGYTVPLAMLRTIGSHGCFGWIVTTRLRSPCLQKTIVAKLWLAILSTSPGKLWRRSQIMASSLLNNQIMANLWYTLDVKNQLVKETLTCQKQYMFGRNLSFTRQPPKYVGKCPSNSPLVLQAREGRSCGVCLYAYSDPQWGRSPIYGMTTSQ